MPDKVTTREELQFTDSSDKSKAVLGVLEGPCADFISATRNGRKYSETLWEKVFNSPIVQELLDNGGIPGELDHPADRSETDSTKIAVIMQEKPKKKNGELWAKFSILNTPCGQIAYTLAKAGFKFGISSRGEGDVYTDYDGVETVDEDTYDFKGFDLVLIPAVKAARLNLVTEGLNNKFNYRKALKESLANATEEDRKIMENTLANLNIKLVENIQYNGYSIQIGDSDVFVRDGSGEVVGNFPTEEEAREYIDSLDESLDKDTEQIIADEITDGNSAEEENNIHEYDFSNEDSIEMFLRDFNTVVDSIELEDDDEDVKSILSSCKDKLDNLLDNNQTSAGEIPDDIYVTPEDDKADDAGLELIEQLQDALRSKSTLEKNLIELQEKLSVCYTKESESEQLIVKQNKTISRLNESLKENSSLRQKIAELTRQLNEAFKINDASKMNIQKLNESIDGSKSQLNSLNEALADKDNKIKMLTERNSKLISNNKKLRENFASLQTSSDNDKDSLNEALANARNDLLIKTKEYSQNLQQEKQLKEKYKKIAKNAVDKYISLQASKIGVSPNEIRSRLAENYTFSDIDKVCEDLRDYKVNISRLPFNVQSPKSKVRINLGESFNDRLTPKNEDDEIDEQLLRIAQM